MALNLDFSGLDSITPAERPQEARKDALTPGAEKSATEGLKRKLEPAEKQELEGAALNKLQGEQESRQRYIEVYAEYQKNIKTCSQLIPEILRGVKAGEDTSALFLKACRVIALMTGNQLFYEQIEADMTAIYGEGLLQPAPLERQLEELEERQKLLAEALDREETETDSRKRIEGAIKAHKEKEQRLRDLLEKTA